MRLESQGRGGGEKAKLKTEEVEEECDGEDWLMVDENAKETMTEGPLDYAPAPISEFIVKSRTKMKADRWEIL